MYPQKNERMINKINFFHPQPLHH